MHYANLLLARGIDLEIMRKRLNIRMFKEIMKTLVPTACEFIFHAVLAAVHFTCVMPSHSILFIFWQWMSQ